MLTELRPSAFLLLAGGQLGSGHLTVAASLDCRTCQGETRHEVHYVAGLLHWVRCQRCGWRWEIDHQVLEEHYLRQVPLRIATKPLRLGLEARHHPARFVRSFPFRVMTKPIRLASEMVEVAGLREA